jgi:hypothetical protein
MVEAGNVLGVLAAVLLLIAAISWSTLVGGPLTQRTDGRTGIEPPQGELACELLFWAAGLSGAAAFMAVVGRIFA